MDNHGYESGRLNLPFVGLSTFGKKQPCLDWDTIDADCAILGAPYDFGTQYRPGARFGPRAIREASTLFSFGHAGAYDHEDDAVYLSDSVRIVDMGDADIVHTNTEKSHANIEFGVRKVLKAGALPVVLGGDHSINIPCVRAFSEEEPIHIVQIDAHLDFVDERFGVRQGHGNPARRISEMKHVSGLTQLGIRGPGSSGHEDFDAAKAYGAKIIGPRDFKKNGAESVVDRLPKDCKFYVTIDVDVFDPSLAPGTGSPSPGGLDYFEVTDVLRGIAARGEVVGFDVCEVAPAYDTPNGITAQLASRVILDFIGAIFSERRKKLLSEVK
jgi:agmatinase